MNKDKKLVYSVILSIFVLVYIIIYRVLICNLFLASSEAISASFMILLASLSAALLGFRKYNNSKNSKAFLKISLVGIFVYFFCIYAIGLVNGFLNNSYDLKIHSILSNVVFPILIIISTELFRYAFVKANKKNKLLLIIITILLFIFDANFYIRIESLSSFDKIFSTFTTIVLPIALKHALMTYYVYHGDYKTTIVYRMITELYVYLAPIQPNMNNLITSIASISLPFICLLASTKKIEGDDVIYRSSKSFFRIIDIPIILLLVFTICVVFGIGPYKLIGIETGSMTPKYNIGDGIIVDKTVDPTTLKVGDVIVYENKNKVLVVHRIVKINMDNSFVTQGDANPTPDMLYVTQEQVRGIVRLKIPFIAYPALMFK